MSALRSFFVRRSLPLFLAAALLLLVAQLTAEPGKGTLFGIDPEHKTVLEIDPVSGLATPFSSPGFHLGGVAHDFFPLDATTDNLFLDRATRPPRLYTLDAGGNPTFVATTNLGQARIRALEFLAQDATTDAFFFDQEDESFNFPALLPDGNPAPGLLFASLDLADPKGGDHLGLIDRDTGDTLVLGAFGTCYGVRMPSDRGGACSLDGLDGLAFDRRGRLWGTLASRGVGQPGLYRVDPGSGQATFARALSNEGRNGPPGAPSGGLRSLQFACDGTLYGGTAQERGGAGDGGRLVAINPATGGFRYVGPAITDTELGGLTFDRPCLTLFGPEPGWSGAVNRLQVMGATPGGSLRLYTGSAVGSTLISVPGCGNMRLRIGDAEHRGTTTAGAGAEGIAVFESFYPGHLQDSTVYFQALDHASCSVSNLGAFTFR